MAKKNEVKEDTQLATQGTTAMAAFDYGEDAVDAGQMPVGAEHQTKDDLVVPFIKIVQPGTPGFAEGTLEGAKLGSYIHSVTGQVFDELYFVCGTTRHDYGEWKDIKEGGGLVGKHDIDSEVVAKAKAASAKFGKYKHPETGNDLVESFYMFGAICTKDGDVLGMAILPFKSTAIKTYKNCISQLRAHTISTNGQKKVPPLYAHLLKFGSEVKKKDKNTWAEPVFKPANGTIASSLLAPDDPRFQMAKACKELLESGLAKVDYAQEGGNAEAKGAEGDPF